MPSIGAQSCQVYPGVLALFREITNHRSNKQREKPPKDQGGHRAMAMRHGRFHNEKEWFKPWFKP